MKNIIYEKELLENIWTTLTKKKENFNFIISINKFFNFYKERPEYRESAVDCINTLIETSSKQMEQTTTKEVITQNNKIDTGITSKLLRTIKFIATDSNTKELNTTILVNTSKLFEIYDKTKNELIIESLEFFCKSNNKTR